MKLLAIAVIVIVLLAPGAGGIDQLLPLDQHDPISIDGDDDLCRGLLDESGVTNCGTATGTCDNPYVISGWRIRASATMPALKITNTTQCILVTQNTLITPTDIVVPTVVLLNVRNVHVVDNLVQSGQAPGLVAEGFYSSTIRENRITGAPAAGEVTLVRIVDAPGVKVFHNLFNGTSQSADKIKALVHVTRSGSMRADWDSRTVFEGNRYETAAGTGLFVESSRDISLASESFWEVLIGISLTKAPTNLSDIQMTRVSHGLNASDSTPVTMMTSEIDDQYPCRPACIKLKGIGISAANTRMSLSNVSVSHFDVGITTNSTRPDSDGLYAFVGEYLNVTGNGVGILVHDHGSSRVQNSSIYGNGVGVRNVGTSTFQVKFNWWGCATGANTDGCDSTAGKVHWTPWRTEPVAIG